MFYNVCGVKTIRITLAIRWYLLGRHYTQFTSYFNKNMQTKILNDLILIDLSAKWTLNYNNEWYCVLWLSAFFGITSNITVQVSYVRVNEYRVSILFSNKCAFCAQNTKKLSLFDRQQLTNQTFLNNIF